jgi:hypothetical protein
MLILSDIQLPQNTGMNRHFDSLDYLPLEDDSVFDKMGLLSHYVINLPNTIPGAQNEAKEVLPKGAVVGRISPDRETASREVFFQSRYPITSGTTKSIQDSEKKTNLRL